MKSFRSFAVGLAALTAAAGANAQPPPPPAPPPTGHACFWKQDVSNFNAMNDTTIYVRVGVSQVWELTLFGNCFDLSWLHRIGLQTFGGENSICEGEMPGLNIVTRSVATGPQQCLVTAVRKLGPAEVAAIPKSARP
jgi:hypothetical protein